MPTRTALLALALALPTVGWAADTIAVTPLVSSNASEGAIQNFRSLMAFELGSRSQFKSVVELDALPETLTLECLDDAACLADIAKGAGAEKLLTGALEVAPETYQLDLLYFDATTSSVVKRQSFSVSRSADGVATEVPVALTKVVGEKVAPVAEAPAEDGLSDGPPTPAKAPPKPEFDPTAFEDPDAGEAFDASAVAAERPGPTEVKPTTGAKAPAKGDDDEPEDLSDIDEGRLSQSDIVRSRVAVEGPKGPGARLIVAARVGGSNYSKLPFLTYGAEAFVALPVGLQFNVGLEGYTTQRNVPVELRGPNNILHEWNSIFPVNVGAGWRLSDSRFQPWVGADLIFAAYYFNAGTPSMAVGGRGRAGFDFMLGKLVAIDVSAAVGGWGGKNFVIIERGMKNAGLLPQLSAGIALSF